MWQKKVVCCSDSESMRMLSYSCVRSILLHDGLVATNSMAAAILCSVLWFRIVTACRSLQSSRNLGSICLSRFGSVHMTTALVYSSELYTLPEISSLLILSVISGWIFLLKVARLGSKTILKWYSSCDYFFAEVVIPCVFACGIVQQIPRLDWIDFPIAQLSLPAHLLGPGWSL